MHETGFNLLKDNWIPVLRTNGVFERLGVSSVLTQAGTIRQIAASNPMDNVALLRFLLAVLLWCRPELSENDRRLLGKNANGVPLDWLGELDCHIAKFNLFDPEQPFMQDLAVKDESKNAATELLHDLPSGSALNHFRHTRDKVSGLCPACCALGLVRWPCYATAGTKGAGKSMTASPNGNTPTYAFPVRSNLLLCLAMSLMHRAASHDDTPIWESNDRPTSLGFISGLTWKSRSVLLDEPTESDGTPCSYCGSNDGGLVHEIRFQPGWKRLSKEPWDDDPHLVRITPKKGGKGATIKVLIAHPGPNESIDRSAMLWRDLTQGVAESAAANSDDSRQYDVVVVGSAQALLKHAECIRVAPSESARKRAGLSKACIDKLPGLIKSTTANRKADTDKHPEINAGLALMMPECEARIRDSLTRPDTPTNDAAFLTTVCQMLAARVIASTSSGSPLRRRKAIAEARDSLDDAIRKLTAPRNPSAEVDKTLRTRRKKGDDA